MASQRTCDEALDRMLELVVVLNDDMTRGLARVGLTPSRAHALWVIRDHGPCTQRALADALGVTARNVTGLVDALVDTGFVTREPHPADRRATLVSFTERGEAAVARLEAQQKEFAAQLFAWMSKQQLSSFTQTLDDILAGIHQQLSSGEDEDTK